MASVIIRPQRAILGFVLFLAWVSCWLNFNWISAASEISSRTTITGRRLWTLARSTSTERCQPSWILDFWVGFILCFACLWLLEKLVLGLEIYCLGLRFLDWHVRGAYRWRTTVTSLLQWCVTMTRFIKNVHRLPDVFKNNSRKILLSFAKLLPLLCRVSWTKDFRQCKWCGW